MRVRKCVMALFAMVLGAVGVAGTTRATDELDVAAHVQGEYTGRVRRWDGLSGPVGLQVIALGEDRFEGAVYHRGLPLGGWDGTPAWRFAGGREGKDIVLREVDGTSSLVFAPEPYGFFWILDGQGRRVGGLLGLDRESPTMGAAPPPGATVLFDGTTVQGLVDAQVTDHGTLRRGFATEAPYGDFDLHVEFRSPLEPSERGQGRGNSGVYIQRRYEVQILDSFGLKGEFNECGALYRQRAPDVNACLPPGTWQTYDIRFRAARFDAEGNRTEPARITVRQNGVLIHDDVAIASKTGAGQPEGPEPLPILFQDHRNEVEFRNLWIVPR